MISKVNLFIMFLLLVSCQHTVPDVPICVELSMTEAWCRWSISDKRQLVTETSPLVIDKNTKLTWWEMRASTVKLPAQSWAEVKKFIIKICKESELCQQNVSSWDRSTSDVDTWLKENNR